MTSVEMLREFKVGLDKIDSSSYPEIYDEQIFMFINRFIISLVNVGRKNFEENQVITDNLKSLLVTNKAITGIPNTDDNTQVDFDLLSLDEPYYFYVKSHAITVLASDITGRASTKVTQHDDIDVVLSDPFNKPKPYKVPITFSKDTITGYTNGRFDIVTLVLSYIKKPAIVSPLVNCDLDEQLHYTVVEGAIALATEALGIRVQELNRQ